MPAAHTSQVGVEGKLIAIVYIASSSKMEHISTTGIGGHLLQALFPPIISAWVKAIMLAAVMAPTMPNIPSSHPPSRCIGAKPTSKQRRISLNAVWYISRESVAPRVQGSTIFNMPTQRRRYCRLLVLQSTS